LDASTQAQLRKGERTVELLKQDVYQPLPVEQQIALLKINDEGLLDKLPVERIGDFENQYLETVGIKYEHEMSTLAETGVLNDAFAENLIKIATSVIDQITSTN
jgi:F-type H+-transporting ATPase subunit alpha